MRNKIVPLLVSITVITISIFGNIYMVNSYLQKTKHINGAQALGAFVFVTFIVYCCAAIYYYFAYLPKSTRARQDNRFTYTFAFLILFYLSVFFLSEFNSVRQILALHFSYFLQYDMLVYLAVVTLDQKYFDF